MISASRFWRAALIAVELTGVLAILPRAQAQPYRQQDEGALPPVDPAAYESLSEAELECPRVSGAPVAGVRGCNDFQGTVGFKSDVMKLVKERLDREVALRYQGKEIKDWKTAETVNAPGPVCNLLNGENGEACGQYCKLSIALDVGLFSGVDVEVKLHPEAPACGREKAWYFGFEVAGKKAFLYQVAKEFKTKGKFSLSRMDGEATACHMMAYDVMRSQKEDLNASLDMLMRKYGDDVASLKCQRGVAGVSHTPCRNEMIQGRLANLWAKLIRCEGLVRFKNDFRRRVSNSESMQSRAQSAVEPKCKNQYNADCIACSSSTRNNRLNRCYQNEMPKALKEEFKAYDSQGLERELYPTTSQAGVGFAFSLASLARARRRGRRSRSRRDATVLTAIFLALALCFGGCATATTGGLGQLCPEDENQSASQGASDNPYCPNNPESNNDTDLVSDMGGAAEDLALNRLDARAQVEDDGLDNVRADGVGNASAASLAAEAVDRQSMPGGDSRGNSSGRGDAQIAPVGSIAPRLMPGGGDRSQGQGAQGGGLAGLLGDGGADGKPVEDAALGAVRAVASDVQFEAQGAATASGESRAAVPSFSGFSGLGGFGAGEAGPSVGGAAGVGFNGTGEGDLGGAMPMDRYLEKVGRVSLFEIVNRRTDRFTRQIAE